MLDLFKTFFTPDPKIFIYALKITFCALMALGTAMYFQMDNPKWAFMTVYIAAGVAKAGPALLKGVARLIGTFVGMAVSVGIIAIASQKPFLWCALTVAWFMLCITIASSMQSPWSYIFTLGSYTTTIISIGSVEKEEQEIFISALARMYEIGLGVIWAFIAEGILFPNKAYKGIPAQVDDLWKKTRLAIKEQLSLKDSEKESVLKALGGYFDIDSARKTAMYEGSAARKVGKGVSILNMRFLEALRSGRKIAQYERTYLDESLQPWVNQIQDALKVKTDAKGEVTKDSPANLDHEELQALHHQLDATSDSLEYSHKQRYGLKTMAFLVKRLERAQEAYAQFSAGNMPAGTPAKMNIQNDVGLSALYAFRSGIAYVLIFLWWVMSGWESLTSAIIMGAVGLAFFANSPQGPKQSRGMAYATFIAFLPSAWLTQHYLPYASGTDYLYLCVGFFWPLFLCSLATGNKNLAFISGTVNILIASNTAITNQLSENTFVSLINSTIAMGLSFFICAVVFSVMTINLVFTVYKDIITNCLETVRELATLNTSIEKAEQLFSDQFSNQIYQLGKVKNPADKAKEDDIYWERAVTCLDLGNALIALRVLLQGKSEVHEEFKRFLNDVKSGLKHKPKPKRADQFESSAKDLILAVNARLEESVMITVEGSMRNFLDIWKKLCNMHLYKEVTGHARIA